MEKLYNSDFGIATLINSATGIRLNTAVQRPGVKQASINAYLGARYSRSLDPVVTILAEVVEKNQDAAARLAHIVNGYGHKSVAGMGSIMCFLEEVPVFFALKFFNENPVLDGQETSTRYKSFEKVSYRKLPPHYASYLQSEYNRIMERQVSEYIQLLTKTEATLAEYFEIDMSDKKQVNSLKARSLDVARYLLPTGLNTNVAAVMSARAWAEYIGYLRGASTLVEQEVGDMLLNLLSGDEEFDQLGYVPEAAELIKYTNPNSTREETTKALMELLASQNVEEDFFSGYEGTDQLKVSDVNSEASLLHHILLLLDPVTPKDTSYFYNPTLLEEVGKIIFKRHNHHNQLGNLAQSGSMSIFNQTTLDVIKDLNRHRSLEKFVPLFNNQVNIEAELSRDENLLFGHCYYLDLPELRNLRKEYADSLKQTYKDIQSFLFLAQQELRPELVTEYVRYLLPHAHKTAYQFYGSPDDIMYTANLRVRPGGHINYREEVYFWVLALADKNPLWRALAFELKAPYCGSREQFLDRS